MLDLESTGRYSRLAHKPKQKYILFSECSLAVVVTYDVDKDPHIFLTRENRYNQEINRHFDGTLIHFGPVVFA